MQGGRGHSARRSYEGYSQEPMHPAYGVSDYGRDVQDARRRATPPRSRPHPADFGTGQHNPYGAPDPYMPPRQHVGGLRAWASGDGGAAYPRSRSSSASRMDEGLGPYGMPTHAMGGQLDHMGLQPPFPGHEQGFYPPSMHGMPQMEPGVGQYGAPSYADLDPMARW